MVFKPFEIDFIIKPYAYEVERLKAQRDHLQSIVADVYYDDYGLSNAQIRSINVRIDELEARIKELKDFRKEL